MKINVTRDQTIILLGIFVFSVIIIFISLYVPGMPLNGSSPSVGVSETGSLSGSEVTDSWFDVSEYQQNSLQNRTVFHITDDELKPFPDLKKIFRDAETNTRPWSVIGQRYAGGFDGNMTRYLNFVQTICNNTTLDVCFAHPPLYEYDGRYFTLSPESYFSHSTAPPTINP